MSPQSIKNQLDSLYSILVQCGNEDAIKTAMKHIQAAKMAVNSICKQKDQNVKLHVKRCYAPNKNFDKQLRFFSTKKKRKTSKLSLAKPTIQELDDITDDLMDADVQCCGVCFKTDDTSGIEDIHWIECTLCTMWIHLNCDPNSNELSRTNYQCPYCRSL